MEVWNISSQARTKGALYLLGVMNSGDQINLDMETTKQYVRKRALRTVGRTKFRTYLTINPDLSGHRMYTDKTADVPDRDPVSASCLRLSSHRLAVETGRWSRKPQNERRCLCGDVQTEEHVICFCPRMALVRSRFDEIRFTSIADFFGCDDVRSVCRMCTLALTVNN